MSSPGIDSGNASTARAATDTAGRIAGAAAILMGGALLSRLLGLVREQLTAGRFGTGDAIAAFTIADSVGTLLYDLMVSGALQAALIPVLTGVIAAGGVSNEVRRVAGTLLLIAAGGLALLCLLGITFAPVVVRGMTALTGEGDARGESTFDLAVTLVRWLLPGTVLLGAGTILTALLHAAGRPAAPALALAARNAAVVLALLLFAGALGVRSLALGTLLGAAAIVALQVPPLARAGLLPRLAFDSRHPAVREVIRLYLPVFLGLLVSAGGTVIDRNLAWGAGEDALGAMRYATTLVQLVLGLVAAAISLAVLPSLSRHHAGGDEAAFRGTLARALAMTTVLILPAVCGLAAIARPVVDLLFGHGATDEADARRIAIALLGYLPGTLAAAYDQVLIFAFYARRDTRTPVVVGLIAVGVYLGVALTLVQPLGMVGLVVANSAQWIAHGLIMWWLLRRRFGWVGDAALRRTVRLTTAVTAVMALAALALWLVLDRLLPQRLPETATEVIQVALPVAVGGAIYAAGLLALRVEEIAALRHLALAPLRRRGGR